MKYSVLALIAFAALFAASGSAQTVMITGQKKVYTRTKPISGYKKTFTINRPVAKTSTPALARKITALIDPVNVFEINLREELAEMQWLSEAGFEEVFNEQGVLTVMLWIEGSAAYSDGVTKYVVVDVTKGVRLSPTSAFADRSGLIAAVKKKQDSEIEKSVERMKADPEFAAHDDPKRLFAEITFEEKDLVNFAVDRAGVAFFYDYGFPNVIKALEPNGELRLSWSEVKAFIRQDGLLARFVH